VARHQSSENRKHEKKAQAKGKSDVSPLLGEKVLRVTFKHIYLRKRKDFLIAPACGCVCVQDESVSSHASAVLIASLFQGNQPTVWLLPQAIDPMRVLCCVSPTQPCENCLRPLRECQRVFVELRVLQQSPFVTTTTRCEGFSLRIESARSAPFIPSI
jgi:hypothetical protein